MYKNKMSKSLFPPASSFQTIVSFLFPKEHSDFLSFLDLCDGEKESGDDDDDDVIDEDDEEEEVEQAEGEVVVGLGLELLHGELGAD